MAGTVIEKSVPEETMTVCRVAVSEFFTFEGIHPRFGATRCWLRLPLLFMTPNHLINPPPQRPDRSTYFRALGVGTGLLIGSWFVMICAMVLDSFEAALAIGFALLPLYAIGLFLAAFQFARKYPSASLLTWPTLLTALPVLFSLLMPTSPAMYIVGGEFVITLLGGTLGRFAQRRKISTCNALRP
jgi:hypothetical protein